MVLGCLGIAAMALALERRIPAAANGAGEISDEEYRTRRSVLREK